MKLSVHSLLFLPFSNAFYALCALKNLSIWATLTMPSPLKNLSKRYQKILNLVLHIQKECVSANYIFSLLFEKNTDGFHLEFHYLGHKKNKEEIWPSPMTKAPRTIRKWKSRDNTNTPPQTLITNKLQTDKGRSISLNNESYPTGVVKPVNGIPTFPLTEKAL